MDKDLTPFRAAALHPKENVIRPATWLPHYFGINDFGVQFEPRGPVFGAPDCIIPHDQVFAPYCAAADYPPEKH